MPRFSVRWVIVFSLAVLFGWLGLHRFAVKKTGTGFIFLFSAGVVGIGWLVDVFPRPDLHISTSIE